VVVKQHDKPDETYELHGAAVVFERAHRQVRRDGQLPRRTIRTCSIKTYAQLSVDRLISRCSTRHVDTLEPGSTVKPMVGLWGMHEGVLESTRRSNALATS